MGVVHICTDRVRVRTGKTPLTEMEITFCGRKKTTMMELENKLPIGLLSRKGSRYWRMKV